MFFTTVEPLARQASMWGLRAKLVPPALFADPVRLGLAAACHVAASKVKIAIPAYEHAQISPLGGALDIRSGENADDALRLSLLTGIALSLDDASQATVST